MDNQEKPFLGHLEELRRRIIRGLVGLGFGFAEKLLHWLAKPLPHPLVFINPTEAFVATIEVAFFAGLVLALPYICWQLWGFLAPGLLKNEQKPVLFSLMVGAVLFFTGLTFAYYIMLPWGLKFLTGFGSPLIVPMITLGNYLSFCLVIMFVLGLVFNFPLLVVLLTRLGMVTPQKLSAYRYLAFLVIMVASAVLTPPDVFSQLLLSIPLAIIYEISILVSRFFLPRHPQPE